MAEREGFEPSIQVTLYTNFPGWRLQPLGHLSVLSTSLLYSHRSGLFGTGVPHPFGAAHANAYLCKSLRDLSNPRYKLPCVPSLLAAGQVLAPSATRPSLRTINFTMLPIVRGGSLQR
jgi:hypothetical protein